MTDNMNDKPNLTTFKSGNKAAKKHGIRAVEERGTAAMNEQRMGFFASLRKQVETHPGRLDLRHDLAAMAVLLAKLFFSQATKEVKEGINIVDSPSGKRVGYHIALADRILGSIPDEDEHDDSATIIKQSLEVTDESNT